MNEAPCTHEHDVDQRRLGFRAPTSRWWHAVEDVVASRARMSSGRTEHVDVGAGTHLRLDQTDVTFGTSCCDAWISQRFLVLDGPLVGECVVFCAPDVEESWVPDALHPDEPAK